MTSGWKRWICLAWLPLASLSAHAVTPTIAVGAFDNTSYYIDSIGRLYGWGRNTTGQMGDGSVTQVSSPKALGNGYVSAAKGQAHVVALKADGTVWAWGAGAPLGDGTWLDRATPVLVGGGYSAVWAGGWHSLALKTDGTLWSWGSNGRGQLGTDTTDGANAPEQVGSGFKAVAAGDQYTVALKIDGTLWAWGQNESSQLGDGTTTDRLAPVQIGSGYSTLSGAAGNHMAALKTDGTLWAWGNNDCGQLGDGTNTTRTVPVQIGSGYSAISTGACYTMAIKTDGTLWAWGGNWAGQLGDGTNNGWNTPRQVGSGYVSVVAGDNWTLALKTDGSLWAWGQNTYGQLGDGTTTDRWSPVLIGNGYRTMSARRATTLAVKSDGSLWGWGDNASDVLLTGGGVYRTTPRLIGEGYSSITAQRASPFQDVFAIKTDGTLWGWGINDQGQLGVPGAPTSSTPRFIGSGYRAVASGQYGYTAAVMTDGTLWAWGGNWNGQLGDGTTTNRSSPVQIGSGYSTVAAGNNNFMVALKTDGTLWTWGNNANGQLGDGTTSTRSVPVQIGSGFSSIAPGHDGHAMALKTDGTLWAWGQNNCGQLGDGTKTDRLGPVQIGSGYSAVAAGGCWTVALKPDGTLWGWGSGPSFNSWTPTQIGNGYSAVAAGGWHILAVKSDGSVWAWGNNSSGQVGDGSQDYRGTPVGIFAVLPGAPGNVLASAGNGQAAVSFSPPSSNGGAAISSYTVTASPGGQSTSGRASPITVTGLSNGTSYTFSVTATNSVGGGLPSAPSNAVTPAASTTTPGTAGTTADVSIGAYQEVSYYIDSSGNLYGWGSNANGQMGDGRTTQASSPTMVGSGYLSVAKGRNHAAAIKADGTLWAWGSSGRVGDGTWTNRAEPVQIGSGFTAVSAGSWTTMALKADGTLWGWGDNWAGTVGVGNTDRQSAPVQVGSGFKTVSVGDQHTVAIKTDGTLWAWGQNNLGQLGDGSTTNRLAPVQIGSGYSAVSAGNNATAAIRADGTLWTWGENGCGQLGDGTNINRSTPVQVGSGYQVVSVGNCHTMAIKTDGTLWAWGSNYRGQLGDGTNNTWNAPRQVGSGFVSVVAGEDMTVALTADGSLWAWGRNNFGQLGDGSTSDRKSPVQIGSGYSTASSRGTATIAVKTDGTLWTWGDNSYGLLLIGGVVYQTTPRLIGDGFSSITATRGDSRGHTLALKTDGSLWGWGSNDQGQLVAGGATAYSTPILIGGGYSSVAAGSRWDQGYSVAVKADGTLWAWGVNSQGELGDGTEEQRQGPVQVGSGFSKVATGLAFTVALKTDGTLWTWGMNDQGQLGDGTTTDRLAPVQIGSGYSAIAPGNDGHAMAIKADGTLWAWGQNNCGQVGDGTKTNRLTPVQIGSGYIVVAAGGCMSVALKPDGTLWGWGGVPGFISALTPTQIGSGYTAVAAGGGQILAAKSDGSVLAWGGNNAGQVGNGSQDYRGTPVGIVTVLAGAPTNVLASAGNGRAAVCFSPPANNGGAAISSYTVTASPGGKSGSGSDCPITVTGLANGASYTFTVTATTSAGTGALSFPSNAVTPSAAASIPPTLHGPMITAWGEGSLYLNSDGSVWGTGNLPNYWPGATSPVQLLQLPNVIAVAGNGGNAFALLADGTLWGTGWNGNGELADGTTVNRPQPQRIPGLAGVKAFSASFWSHFLALKEDGSVWAWGRNDQGQLGDGTQTDRHVPGKVSGLSNITAVSASNAGGLALEDDGTVWVWGATCCGAAGNGIQPSGQTDPENHHLIPTQVKNLIQVVAIAAGDQHHMALRADGTVWTWGIGNLGENGTGQLLNQASHELLPVQVPGLNHVVAIDARGSNLSLALKDDGTVWAWGSNSLGRLGVSGITYSASPIQVPGLSEIVAITSGMSHIVALRRDGAVLTWGLNGNGQLGDGTLQDRSQPLPVLAQGGSGQLNLLQPAPTSYNQLPSGGINLSSQSGTVPLTVQATAVNANDRDGTIVGYYWKSSDGQVATGPAASFTFAQAGTYQIDLLIQDNVGGRANTAQSVFVAPTGASRSVTPKVGISGAGGIALADDGHILTWGTNGMLGFYDQQAQWKHPTTNSLPIANGMIGVVDFAVSGSGAMVLLADGTVSSWGSNNFGQLGVGSQLPYIGQPQQIAQLPPVQALASGGTHSLAVTRDGRVFAWGGNTYGQLGLGDSDNRFEPVEVSGLSNIVAVISGWNFSAALKSDGTVWAWGDNTAYQLGDGTQISSNLPIQIPGLAGVKKLFTNSGAIFAQKADGTIWMTSWSPAPGIAGDPGPQSGPRHVSAYDGYLQIAGSWNFIVALKADGTVWTGGMQNSLALGVQNSGDISGLRQLPGITDAISVAASDSGVMVLQRDGTVLSWGINTNGQLGDGTLAQQQTPGLVVNETANGFLDLIPEVPNAIQRDRTPPFFLATYADGGLSATTLYADLRGIIPSGGVASASDFGRFAAGYNIYVAAAVPSAGTPLYFQLDSSNSWSTLHWPMAEFLRGVALDSQDALVRAQILQNMDLSSALLAGTSLIVGYGTDPDEMLRNARYRTIFTVPQP